MRNRSLQYKIVTGLVGGIVAFSLVIQNAAATDSSSFSENQVGSGWVESITKTLRPFLAVQANMVHVPEVAFLTDEDTNTNEISIHRAAAAQKITFQFEGGLSTKDQNYESRRVKACLTVLPAKYRKQVKKITIKSEQADPRGLANAEQIILSIRKLSTKEVCNVVIHEMGHVIDLGYFQGTSSDMSNFKDGAAIPLDDPSIQFYRLSWQDEKTKLASASDLDFISGYAMSEVFEDFGESMTAYVRQGNYFRSLLGTSDILRAKYNFLRDVVFDGVEYDSGTAATDPSKRVYDATQLGVTK